MAGLLTHVGIAFVGAILIGIIFRKSIYSFAFALGHLMPDFISFGITGIKQKSLNPEVIMTNDWFSPLAAFSHNPFYWIIFGTVIWLATLLLYRFNKLSKAGFATIILVLSVFLIGVGIHLLVDGLIIEANYWI